MGINIAALFAGISFSDVVDIVIVSFVFYKGIEFINKTRAGQLTKGLFFIIVAFFVSEWGHFYTLSWLIGKVLNVGLIALIIVFQPELRRALEYIGKNKFSSRGSLEQETITGMVKEITAAIGYFASIKEGALIVIERDIALNDIAEKGTIVNANISESLLENIFYEGSPLHDGAVIIRRDKIYSAACVLPLTENTNLSKDLGTRHRAGIGISEVSDAIVLIVSEETGIISMASEGKLSRFLDVRTVEKTLLNFYMSRLPKENQNSFMTVINKVWGKKDDQQQDS